MKKHWEISPIDEKKQQTLAKTLHISPILAQILVHKNFSLEEATLFLNSEQITYHNPFLLKDMDKVVDLWLTDLIIIEDQDL